MLKSLDFTRVLTSFIFRYLPINSVIFFTIPEWFYNSKSVCAQAHEGSNPSLSAILPQFSSKRVAVFIFVWYNLLINRKRTGQMKTQLIDFLHILLNFLHIYVKIY